ncbi:MAG: PilZ domain-containing protein, partial [Myxococcaceae bacterium]
FIATVPTVEIGTEVDLGFSLADGEKLNVQGVVRWVREVNDLTPDIFPGVGIQFVNLDPATAGAIQQFVSSREPMFFPE